MERLKAVPWQAWGRQALRYLIFVCAFQLTGRLLGGRPGGLVSDVIIAFIVLDGRTVWRRLTTQRNPGGGQRPRPTRADRLPLLVIGGGVVLFLALGLGLQAIVRHSNMTVLKTEHLVAEVFATDKELASRAVDHLESRLGELELAYGLTVTKRPLIRIYDWDDFDVSTLGNSREGQIRVRVGIDARVNDAHTDKTVIIHEYAHFLTRERTDSVGPLAFIHVPLWLNEGLSFWYGGGADTGMKPADALPLSRLTHARASVEVLNQQSFLMVSALMERFGEQRTLSLIEAYAREDADPLGAIGITEAVLLDQVRASLTK